MFSNRLALAALAGTCVAAATGGGYLAVRHNAPEAASTAAQAAELPAASPIVTTAEHPAEQVLAGAPPQEAVARPAPVQSASTRIDRSASNASARRPTPVARPVRPAAEPAAAAPTPTVPAVPVQSPGISVLESRVAEEALPRTWQQVPPPPEELAIRDVIVPADSVIGLAIASTISSETAAVEDRVEARVVRDVRAGGEIAIPAGARAIGSVTVVEAGGRFREQARLGIRFHALRLTDGTEIPVSTEAIYRLGNAPGNATAAKIGGGAVAGAILGGILGGSKGAAIGATSGAGAGTAVVYAGDRSEAAFASGLEVTARFLSDVVVPATFR